MGLGMMAVPETVTVVGKERKDSSGWRLTWLGMGQTDLTTLWCVLFLPCARTRGSRLSVSIPS